MSQSQFVSTAEGDRVLLYHEVQESKLCGVHCLNAILQGPYYSEVELAAIAHELDQVERQVMLESGATSSHFLNFIQEGSSNVAPDGNFSFQVLNYALQVCGLQCMSFEAPEAQEARSYPPDQQAFICHLQGHWFTIRKVRNEWYNFNSLYPAPEHLSNFYLSAYLDTLKSSGWSIFLVKGVLPAQNSACSWESGSTFGKWITPEEACRITKSAKKAETTKIEYSALSSALAATMSASPFQASASGSFAEHDERELSDTIAASLRNVGGSSGKSSVASTGVPESNEPAQQQEQTHTLTQAVEQSQRVDYSSAAALAQALAESMFSAASEAGVILPPADEQHKRSDDPGRS